MQHTKHTKLARPPLGRYGRCEWAIVGTTCGSIRQLADSVISALSDRWHCGYLDADHAGADATPLPPGTLAAGARLEYVDAIHSRRLLAGASWGTHQFRALFNETDLILVNGNHHEAAAQVVVIDPAKENSLRKRLHQLTDVQLFLLTGGATGVFDFVRQAVPNADGIPALRLDDTENIAAFFANALRNATPAVNGLVLAGGRSTRMGRDKSTLDWHGKPQRDHLAALLRPFCEAVYLSCRPDQDPGPNEAWTPLPDTFTELGPYGAILSAFRQAPGSAWLIVACDLPRLDTATLDFLMRNRQPRCTATAFQSPVDGMPEPLIALWEPKSYPVLLSFLAQGYSCPRKVLLNTDAHLVPAPDPAALTNVNTPEEMEKLKRNWKPA